MHCDIELGIIVLRTVTLVRVVQTEDLHLVADSLASNREVFATEVCLVVDPVHLDIKGKLSKVKLLVD